MTSHQSMLSSVAYKNKTSSGSTKTLNNAQSTIGTLVNTAQWFGNNFNDHNKKPVNKARVDISVMFLKIGEIDTLKENYEAEVMIQSKWREPALDKSAGELTYPLDLSNYWNPKIFIENTIGDPKETSFLMVNYNKCGQAYVIEKRRFKGIFMENLELDEFPFDTQDLTVTLMSDRPPEEIQIAEDPDELHKVNRQSFIDAQEWHLYRFVETELREVSNEHEDPNVKRTALMVKLRASRRPAYFIWNIFLITFLISSLSFVTFAVDRALPQNRLQLSFTLVLTCVAFKFVVNQSLPKISYLTYLDMYVLVALVMLACVCVWHGITTLVSEQNHRAVDNAAMSCLAGAYAVFNIGFLLRIYMKEQLRLQLERNQMQGSRQAHKPNSNNAFSVTV